MKFVMTGQGRAAGANPRLHVCLSYSSPSSGGKRENSKGPKACFSSLPAPHLPETRKQE